MCAHLQILTKVQLGADAILTQIAPATPVRIQIEFSQRDVPYLWRHFRWRRSDEKIHPKAHQKLTKSLERILKRDGMPWVQNDAHIKLTLPICVCPLAFGRQMTWWRYLH